MMPIDFLHLCAPDIAPITLAAIVQQESGGNPLVLHDNTTKRIWQPTSDREAAKLAHKLINEGHSIDIGLAQINSSNFSKLGMSVEQALDPCTNLHAAQTVLKGAWEQSGHNLRQTLAAYNTGKPHSVIGAQYSAKVFSRAGVTVPEIPSGQVAEWARHAISWSANHQSVEPIVTWSPAASPLILNGGGLSVNWR